MFRIGTFDYGVNSVIEFPNGFKCIGCSLRRDTQSQSSFIDVQLERAAFEMNMNYSKGGYANNALRFDLSGVDVRGIGSYEMFLAFLQGKIYDNRVRAKRIIVSLHDIQFEFEVLDKSTGVKDYPRSTVTVPFDHSTAWISFCENNNDEESSDETVCVRWEDGVTKSITSTLPDSPSIRRCLTKGTSDVMQHDNWRFEANHIMFASRRVQKPLNEQRVEASSKMAELMKSEVVREYNEKALTRMRKELGIRSKTIPKMLLKFLEGKKFNNIVDFWSMEVSLHSIQYNLRLYHQGEKEPFGYETIIIPLADTSGSMILRDIELYCQGDTSKYEWTKGMIRTSLKYVS